MEFRERIMKISLEGGERGREGGGREREGGETDRQRQREIGGENDKDGRVEFRERIMKISLEGGEREGEREREREEGTVCVGWNVGVREK